MLSYQHAYHAGNMADVHKHAVLALVLDRMVQKPKPISYFETHAGRGLYDLTGPEAARTGEAAAGIGSAEGRFDPAHPFARCLGATRAVHGAAAYPGSPLIAAHLLRAGDRMTLADLHPQEFRALEALFSGRAATGPQIACVQTDGIGMVLSEAPPVPGRGLCLIDPSWEVKADYDALPAALRRLHRKWPVGVLILWYPILTDARHLPMCAALSDAIPGARRHEIGFAPARPGHRMIGSGLFIVNLPWGLENGLAAVSAALCPAGSVNEGLLPPRLQR